MVFFGNEDRALYVQAVYFCLHVFHYIIFTFNIAAYPYVLVDRVCDR